MQKPFKSPFESQLIMATLSPEERETLKKEWEKLTDEISKLKVGVVEETKGVSPATLGYKSMEYNEPEHYHKHDLDTIEFLKRGFPPEVFLAFALGNVIKYAQRGNYKNGLSDLEKMVDYAVRARDWYKETHS